MNPIKLFLLLVISFYTPTGFSASQSFDETTCEVQSMFGGFSLVLEGPFDEYRYAYYYSPIWGGNPACLLFIGYERGSDGVISEMKLLSQNQSELIIESLNSALAINLDGDVQGQDGGSWIISSNFYRGIDIEISVWAPTFSTEERGLSGLVNLRNHLRTFFEE